MTEPQQKPGRSKQDYSTPPEFLSAIARQFGPIDLDLACRVDNMVAPYGLAQDQGLDALELDWADPMYWSKSGNVVVSGDDLRVAFCNPPFGNLQPWASKVASCRWLPRWTLLLVPASMGSRWWVDHVLGRTMAFGIPRMQFLGTDAVYPKDLALVAAGFGVAGHGYWDWRKCGASGAASVAAE
jgi:hypothetical protein